MENNDKICIEFVQGQWNSVLCINDYRITDSKLWGFGHILCKFKVSMELLRNSCNEKGEVKLEAFPCYNELCINGKPTQRHASLKKINEYIAGIESLREYFLHTGGRHDWSRCIRYRWTVSLKDIEHALK